MVDGWIENTANYILAGLQGQVPPHVGFDLIVVAGLRTEVVPVDRSGQTAMPPLHRHGIFPPGLPRLQPTVQRIDGTPVNSCPHRAGTRNWYKIFGQLLNPNGGELYLADANMNTVIGHRPTEGYTLQPYYYKGVLHGD